MRTALVSAAVVAVPLSAAAQTEVGICLDASLRAETQLELNARSHSNRVLECPDNATPEALRQFAASSGVVWLLTLRTPTPLGDVWVIAIPANGDIPRQTLVNGPRDQLDPRAVAITAASLLESAPELPVSATREVSPLPAEADADEPVPATGSTETLEPEVAPTRRLVPSRRLLRRRIVVGFGVEAAVHRTQGLVGGKLLVGGHLAPRFRFDMHLNVDAWAQSNWLFGFGIGFFGVLGESTHFFELGPLLRFGGSTRPEEGVDALADRLDFGGAAHLGYQRVVSRRLRFFVHLEAGFSTQIDIFNEDPTRFVFSGRLGTGLMWLLWL